VSSLEARIRQALSTILLPKLDQNLIGAGMVERIQVSDGHVRVLLHFKPAYASKSQLRQWVNDSLRSLEGISQVSVEFTAEAAAPPARAPQRTVPPQARTARRIELPNVRGVLAVFSGKGGVGKSTVSVNLAVALAQAGARVGLFDADVHGPNIPHLLGLDERPMVAQGKIQPIEKYGLKTISLGLLVDPEEALIWRGPMITKAIHELLSGVEWGNLDYMIIDLPPGTGDAQLGLAQDLELSGSLAVTTPQEVALADVRRGITTFKRLEVPIWGIIENMSYFLCPHCGEPTEIFGSGGGEREAQRQGIPLLGRIPLDPAVREGGDQGVPIVIRAPESLAAQEFRKIAQHVLQQQRQTI
jgi:ATP-binding protein involved in chromosome partitioning